jgi:hypothetical protein
LWTVYLQVTGLFIYLILDCIGRNDFNKSGNGLWSLSANGYAVPGVDFIK